LDGVRLIPNYSVNDPAGVIIAEYLSKQPSEQMLHNFRPHIVTRLGRDKNQRRPRGHNTIGVAAVTPWELEPHRPTAYIL
jgi:hypothetical protein